eukprot:TRINITY_DN88673_c0_g1_i1.p1 TRINITY_DN88673_c0_g1~~TRINITY_DN88673_c0_g1_i1.p1  ORF type:complete len:106 (+),score=14.53 TRINITY_DN88673_c0_g1_i1:34-351(+)
MAFTGDEAEEFPLDLAAKWTENYRAAKPGRTTAHFFGYKIIEKILKQENCVGIRCYYALDEKGQPQLIMVGTDANQNDILNPGIVAELSRPCPTFCSTPNPLTGV